MFETPTIVQLRITLLRIEPPIWRRLLVPRSATLADLHHIIQAAFGWLDYHLHQFEIGGLCFSDPDLLEDDDFDNRRTLPEKDVRLFDFLHDAPPFLYLYDFGDDWHHRIEIEALALAEPDRKYPACLGGERSRPPEDVGGVGGYETFLEIFQDPAHPEHRDLRRWAGKAFHPEAFDLAKTDRAVRSAVRAAKRRQAADRYR